MKAIAKKSSTTTPATQAANQPFFTKAGGGNFFAPVNRVAVPSVQTKMTVNKPGDKFEQEADKMADKVMRMPSSPAPIKEEKLQKAEPKEKLQKAEDDKLQKAEPEEKLQKAEDDKLQKAEPEEKIQKAENDKLQKAEPEEKIQKAEDNKLQKAEPEEKIQKQEQAELQRKASSGSPAVNASIQSSIQSKITGGQPLAHEARSYMEPRFGADFSQVRIHSDAEAASLSNQLSARAFTYQNHIFFSRDQYQPGTSRGKELLAHELTHTIQQGGAGKTGTTQAKIQRWPDWVSDAANWVSDTASNAAGAVVEGAEYVGGKVVDGARWVGGQVADGARWAGEQISAAAQWVIDQIRTAINSGTNYLTEQWENIKQFGSSGFDTIKNGFGNLVHFVTHPLSSLMSALSVMNADLLGSVWNLLKNGANALWAGINSVINGVLQIGEGIWNSVSVFVNGIFNTVAGLFDNSAFNLLPDFIKQEARSILNGLRSLWSQVSAFWTDLWQRLTSGVQEILAGVRSFVDNVIGFSIDGVISMVRDLKEVYDYVMKFFADPRATIQPFLDQIAAKLNAEAPPRANALGNQMAQGNYQGNATPTTANGNIQRQESDSEERNTASLDEIVKGILYYIAQFWDELDIKQMLWQTVVNSFWPPATIEAIYKEFSDLWNDHWATTVDSLYAPQNFFDDPVGCLHDIWSNFLILLDFPLSLWRTLNHVAGLLIGYITILVVLVEAILGGAAAAEVGVVPGLLAGAAAGLATMAPIAAGLIASYVSAESNTVTIILVRLFTARQTCEKRQVDISTSVSSFIAMAVALVLEVLMALLAELVNLIAGVLKGAPKSAPQPQPVPVQPTVPAQPVAPVIPLRPRPVTPEQPGRIAAKFEDGVSQAPLLETGNNKSSAESANNSDILAESNPVNGSIALLGMQGAENGIVQTARKDKIDPDACKEEKCDLPYQWWLQKGATASRLIYCGKNKNFIKHEHHTWPKNLGGPHAGQDPLLPVAERIHLTEFHGNSGPIGSVHKAVETYLNQSTDYKNLLQGKPLNPQTTSEGNQLLINAMRIGGGNDAVLRSRVKAVMMGYYGYYTANSKPQMPVTAYSASLNNAENNIS